MEDDLLKFKPSIRTGKKGDLSDFERGMVVGARRAGLSISKTADLLGFSPTTIFRVYREWSEKEKISSERQLCGRTNLQQLLDAIMSIWTKILKECFQHLVEYMPRRITVSHRSEYTPYIFVHILLNSFM